MDLPDSDKPETEAVNLHHNNKQGEKAEDSFNDGSSGAGAH